MKNVLQLIIPSGWWRELRSPTGPAVRFAICRTCRLRHQLVAPDIDARFAEFARRHVGHALDMISVRNPDLYAELLALQPNADVKQAFQGAQTLTTTSLQSLANSATAGWQSGAIDNSSNLYLDDLFQIVIAAVNTAPANSKGLYVLAGHSIDGGTTYTRPFSGTQGTCTFDDPTTLPLCAPALGFLPYATQNTALNSPAYSMAATCPGFVLPDHYVVGIIAHAGFTTASSGNVVKHNGVYRTVI